MPNKLIATAVAAVTLALCGQAFAQGAAPNKSGLVPNVNANVPDSDQTPKTHKHKSHAKKSKSPKTSLESKGNGAGPSTDGAAATPSQ